MFQTVVQNEVSDLVLPLMVEPPPWLNRNSFW